MESCARLMGVSCLIAALLACSGSGRSEGSNSGITHGPMLGHQGANEIGVWGRTARPGTLRVRYGENPAGLDQVSASVRTTRDHDNTAWIRLTGLKADTRYSYRLESDGRPGPGGSFRTLPDAAGSRHPKHNPKGLFNFKFEFACGNNQGVHSLGTDLPTFKTMFPQLRDEIHFAILNGDWLYEDVVRGLPASEWRRQVGLGSGALPRTVELAPTIVGVWENYKIYLARAPRLAEWHRNVPSCYTFDDHEILNDVVACGETGYRDRRTVFRDIALQAWYDYLGWSNPDLFRQSIHFGKGEFRAGSDVLADSRADFTRIDMNKAANLHVHWGTANAGVDDPAVDDRAGGDPNAGVYEIVEVLGKDRLRIKPAAKKDGRASYSIGRLSHSLKKVGNCDFYFLDTRTHRQKHDLTRPDKPGVSMLGLRQRKWLMESMAASSADFFFVLSSVNFMIPHVGAGGMAKAAPDKDDAWTAFLEEREKLIKFWDGLGKPVFILTGDLHNSFAIKVTDRVWEFASGPHNSRNHDATSEGDRPPNGTYDSRGRKCDIRWSTYFGRETPRDERKQPVYCVVQVNNVFRNPSQGGGSHWVAFPKPHVIFQYHDGFSGRLLYAETIRAED